MIKEIAYTPRNTMYNNIVASLEDLGFAELSRGKWLLKGSDANKIYVLISDLQKEFDLKSIPGQLTFSSASGLKVIITKSLTGTLVELR